MMLTKWRSLCKDLKHKSYLLSKKKCSTSFNFINKSHNIATLKILNNDMTTLVEDLNAKISMAPTFYQDMPVILEFENQDVDSKYLKLLIKKIKKINLYPIAVSQTSDTIKV